MQATNMPNTNIILGWPQLESINPIIRFWKKEQRYLVDPQRIIVVSNKKFKRALRKGPSYAFLLFLQATSSPLELPSKYSEYADVFSEEGANTLPDERARHHAIDLIEGRDPPYGPIYSLSEKELAVLRDYLNSSLEKGWIQRSTSPIRALILFVPKKDGSL